MTQPPHTGTYTFHLESSHRNYKARNVLTLEDRVAVIREYEKNPVYQRLAEKYNCSSKQITNIISNREAVLLYYDNRKADGSTSEERRQRQQKIGFLGKVMFEFIQRVVYHGIQINAASVCRKALQVKESLAIMNFYPNNAWLQNFRAQYKVTEFDLMTLRQSMFLSEPKEESIKAVDLIQFVSRREKQAAKQMPPLQKITTRDHRNDNHCQQLKEFEDEPKHNHFGEPTITYEHDDFDYMDSNDENKCASTVLSLDSDDDDDGDDEDRGGQPAQKQLKRSKTTTNDGNVPPKQVFAALPDIDTYQQALRHLKALEDYALLGDNFRAIGLIEQLQQVLKDPPKGEDFQA